MKINNNNNLEKVLKSGERLIVTPLDPMRGPSKHNYDVPQSEITNHLVQLIIISIN